MPAPCTLISSVTLAPRARETFARAERDRRTLIVFVWPAAAAVVPAPIATLRLPSLSRRAVAALTSSRALMVQAEEHLPASFSPRRAMRDGASDGRRLTALESETLPATAWTVAVAPRLRRSAARAARVSFTPTPPAPERLVPEPSRTLRRGRPSRAAVFEETTSAVLLRQSPSQLLSAASRPAEASASESSVETTAKSGGGSPAAAKVTGALEPIVAGGVLLVCAHGVGAGGHPGEVRAEGARLGARDHHRLHGCAARS